MKVNGVHYRSIWYDHDLSKVMIIDQRWLPHDFRIVSLDTLDAFAVAIRDMWVRGAPLIGQPPPMEWLLRWPRMRQTMA